MFTDKLSFGYRAQSLIAISFSSLLLTSCFVNAQGNLGAFKKNDRRSSFSTINVGSISSDQFVTADGKKPVTHLHLKIYSADQSCQNVDEIQPLDANLKISKRVTRGCDYSMNMSLGQADQRDTSRLELLTTFYANSSPVQFSADQESVPVQIRLTLTQDGKLIGLPENLQKPIGGNGGSTPNPVDPNASVPLARHLNVTLSNETLSTNLDKIFTSKYLIVDFSSVGCGYCVQLSQNLEMAGPQSNFAKLTSGKSCRFITIVPSNELSEWNQVIGGGGDSFAKRHSYSYQGGHAGFAQLLNYREQLSTPTVLIIDRQGTIVSQMVGDIPSDYRNFCQE